MVDRAVVVLRGTREHRLVVLDKRGKEPLEELVRQPIKAEAVVALLVLELQRLRMVVQVVPERLQVSPAQV